MRKLCSLLLIALLLTGCATMEPTPDTVPTLATEAPTVQATAPPTTQPATQPVETTQATEPQQFYVEVFREGEADQIPVEIVRGTVGNYTIAMDPEYFTFYSQETVDLFSYDAWTDAPGVFYAVSDYRDDVDPQQYLADAIAQYAPLFNSYSTQEVTLAGFPATAIFLEGFLMDPSYQYHSYLVNCDGNYYLIEASFTMEMYEGLYAIMRACFETMMPIA